MLNHLFRSDDRVFLSRWLRAPLSTGAVTPSGRALARLMAAQIDPEADGHVIELGAGTGAITRALLDAGVDCRRLVLIEKDPVLHGLLSRRYPALKVLLADAAALPQVLAEAGVTRVSAVVSSLPLLSLAERTQAAVLSAAATVMDPASVFVQFTYGPRFPASRSLLAANGLTARLAGFALRNLPPATVWRASLQQTAIPRSAA